MTESFNPIIGEEPLSAVLVGKSEPLPGLHTALVLLKPGAGCVVLKPGDRLSAGERWRGGFTSCVRIDLGQHLLTFELKLATKIGSQAFPASISATCQVTDPEAVARNRSRDLGRPVKERIIDCAQPVARTYEPADVAAAEEAVKTALRRHRFDLPLDIEINSVALGLSPEEANRQRELRKINDDTMIKTAAGQRDIVLTNLENERRRIVANEIQACVDRGLSAVVGYFGSTFPNDPERAFNLAQQTLVLSREEKRNAWEIVQDLLARGIVEPDEIAEMARGTIASNMQALSGRQPLTLDMLEATPGVGLMPPKGKGSGE